MTRRITDDELARRIVEVLGRDHDAAIGASVLTAMMWRDGPWSEAAVRYRLRALRDEGRVVEVAGPRGSLWRLP